MKGNERKNEKRTKGNERKLKGNGPSHEFLLQGYFACIAKPEADV